MASTYLTRTPGSGNTSRYKGTLSVWLKRAKTDEEDFIFNGFESSSNQIKITFKSNAQLQINTVQAGSNRLVYETNRLFRDTNAWYHIVVAIDTTLATAGDRCRLYVNGVEETSFSTETHIAQNSLSFLTEDSQPIYIGAQQGSANYFDGSMSHFHLIDGQQYAPTVFGETDATTGEWKIKTNVTATYGNHGFFILKDGNSVTDQSGNGNNFTISGTLTKTEDCPSNVFATLNPLTNDGGGAKTYSFGNTKVAETANSWTSAHSTLGATSGKWYFEAKVTYTNAAEAYIGASSEQAIFDKLTATHYLGETTGSVGYYTGNGYYYKGAGGVSYGSSVSSGAILGCALDLDNNFIYFSINGTWQNSGDPTSGSSGTNGISLPSGMTDNKHKFLSVSPNESYLECNFGNGYFGTTAVSSAGTNASGNGIFEYDVPTGYTALSTKGLNT